MSTCVPSPTAPCCCWLRRGAAALRRSQLVGMQREHLTFTPEGLRLLISRTRGDQAGRRVELSIPRDARPATCAVRAVEAGATHEILLAGELPNQG